MKCINYKSLFFVFLMAACFFTGCGKKTASYYIEEGILHLKNNDSESAVELFEKAVELEQGNASAHSNLGLAYWKAGRTDEALNSLAVSASIVTDDPRPFEFMSRIYIEKKNWRKAEEALSLALECSVVSPRVLTAMADVNLKTGNVSRAIMYLDQALEMDPGYAPALYNFALIQKNELNNKKGAEESFRKYIKIAEADDAHVQIAKRFLGEGDVVPVKPAQQDVSVEPNKPAVQPEAGKEYKELLSRAATAFKKKEYDAVLVLLKQAVKAAPSQPDALWQLALLYDKHLEYPEKAEELYEEFVRKFPHDPRAAKRLEKAAPVRAENAADDPAAARKAFSNASNAARKGNLDAAIAGYKKAVELDKHFADPAYNLGLAYKKQGRSDLAVEMFETALSRNPKMLSAKYMLGVMYHNSNENGKAVQYLEAVLRAKPNYDMAHYVLGLTYLEMGKRDNAEKHLKRCIELAPNTAYSKNARKLLK